MQAQEREEQKTRLQKGSPLIPKLDSGEILVSDLPPDDKCEVVMITAVENGESYRSWCANIQYTSDDKRVLGEWKENPTDVVGRMVLKQW